jgi:hypothetical protein
MFPAGSGRASSGSIDLAITLVATAGALTHPR